MAKNNLEYYITKFFKDYLPQIKGVSNNTISSYKDTFVLFLSFLKEYKNINKYTFDILKKENVEDFLLYLEEKRKNCIATRNQRLAAIQSFCKFLQYRELECFDKCSSIQSIPHKKVPTTIISYFSLKEIEILLNSPNTKTKNGFRDYVILLFMYETACRAQELVDLTYKQLKLDDNPSIYIHGKGNKDRVVPISDKLKKYLTHILKVFNIFNSEDVIFKNNQNNKFTTKGIEYILIKYVNACKKVYPEYFNNKYSNHCMRHTRAMHLLESGVNLIYIRDILGHSSVTTTEIYAKTNSKIKEKIIREYSNKLVSEVTCVNEKENNKDFIEVLKFF